MMRRISVFLATAFVAAITQAACATDSDLSAIRRYDNATLLKNYALSQCVSRAYGSAESKNDASAAAEGYLQFGEVTDSEAYGDVAKLAEKWLRKNYISKSGSRLQLMKCIDMYHSCELDGLVRKYVPVRKSKPMK